MSYLDLDVCDPSVLVRLLMRVELQGFRKAVLAIADAIDRYSGDVIEKKRLLQALEEIVSELDELELLLLPRDSLAITVYSSMRKIFEKPREVMQCQQRTP